MSTEHVESVLYAEAPPREFWESDLEMALDLVLARADQAGFRDEWVSRRTGRQADVLCLNLGLDGAGSARRKKELLRSCGDELLPYVLVDQFARYKSKVAATDFGKAILAGDVLEICRKNEDEFDTTALLFALYKRDWSDLRLVYHLDKIHKTGFARMRLKQNLRRPEQPIEAFLQPGIVESIVRDFDRAKGDGREGEFKSVVAYDGRCLVFIRRAESPDLVLKAGGVVHGYRPEWIILDFADGAKQVNISSTSVCVPLEIANRLASGYFGQPCEYENESHVVYAKQLERFLEQFRNEMAGEILLVELVVSNSPLDGSPKLKITDPDSKPISEAIGHFEKAVGGILSDIENIESIKVYYRRKRVSLIFEKVEGSDDEYVVRYSDHRLNALERRSFEDHLREVHGIPVLSTEKRFRR